MAAPGPVQTASRSSKNGRSMVTRDEMKLTTRCKEMSGLRPSAPSGEASMVVIKYNFISTQLAKS
jgi:hypothetical protein